MTDQPASSSSPSRCPVCGGAHGPAMRACPRCGAAHHTDCWEWNRGCAIFGCADAPPGDPARTLIPAPEALPEPAGPHDLVVDTALQHEAFLTDGPLPPGVRALYISAFAFLLAVSPAPLLPLAAIIAGLPLALTRVRWEFQPATENAIATVTVAGVPIHRSYVKLGDAARLELRLVHGRAELALVMFDGRALPVTHDVPPTKKALRKLLAVVRGVQAHTHLHVTSSESRDPATMRKRFERLRILIGGGEQADRAGRVSCATLLAMMGVILVAAPVYSKAIAVLAAITGGGAILATLRACEPAPLGGEPGRLLAPRDVIAAERALADLETHGGVSPLAVAGNVALVVTSLLLAAMGTKIANIALLFLTIGAVLNALDWSRARAVQRTVREAQLAEEDPRRALPAQSA